MPNNNQNLLSAQNICQALLNKSLIKSIQAKEILRMREMINKILAKHTGQSMKRIGSDTDRDFFMSGDQAREYGLVDSVIEKHEIPEKP